MDNKSPFRLPIRLLAVFLLTCGISGGCQRQSADKNPNGKVTGENIEQQMAARLKELPQPRTGDEVAVDLQGLRLAVERLGGEFIESPAEEMILVDLSRHPVTDEDLANLDSLHQITHLFMAHTRITDAGLAHLKVATELKSLDISNNDVSDAGLPQLSGLPKLVSVRTHNTKITDAGRRTLAEQLAASRKKIPQWEAGRKKE